MDFRILGPLEVRREQAVVSLGGPKPRAVLAMLLLHANEPVSAERLAPGAVGRGGAGRRGARPSRSTSRGCARRSATGDDRGDDAGRLPPARRAGRARRRALRAARRGRPQRAARRPSGATRRASCARRSRCGAARRSPTSPSSRSRRPRSRGSRSSGWPRSRRAWRPTLAAGRHAELVAELQRLVAEHPDARAARRAADARALPLRPPGRGARGLSATRAAELVGRARRRARAGAAGAAGGDPAPGSRRSSCRRRAGAAARARRRRRRRSSARRRARVAARALGRRARRRAARVVALTGPAGSARPAWRPSSPRRSTGAAPPCCTRPARPRGVGAARSTARDATRADAARGRRRRSRPTRTRPRSSAGARGRPTCRCSCSRSPRTRGGWPAREPDAALDARAARRRGGARDRRAPTPRRTPPTTCRRAALLEASGGVPRARPRGRGPVGAPRGGAPGRARSPGGPRPAAPSCARWRSELAGGVVELQTARERAAPEPATTAPVVCPFKGLASFEADDAPYFFGRERLVAELVARLVGAPLLGVVGPSGSGKSSVVRAGLLPALARGVLPGSEDWQQAAHPARRAPAARARRARSTDVAGGRVVLAVDQFEETFTACRDEQERSRVHRRARRGLAQSGAAAPWSLAIRADYYGRCAGYPELSRLLAANHVLVGSMRRDELRRPSSARRSASACASSPSSPTRSWPTSRASPARCRCCRPRCSSSGSSATGAACALAAYEDTGGVRGAVARLAEEAFGRLDPAQQAIARSVLVRLAEVEPEGGASSAAALPLAELDGEAATTSRDVIALLADSRLLTVSAGTRRGRPRGAAARVAAAAWVDRGGPRRPADPPQPHRSPPRSGAASAATTARCTAAPG